MLRASRAITHDARRISHTATHQKHKRIADKDTVVSLRTQCDPLSEEYGRSPGSDSSMRQERSNRDSVSVDGADDNDRRHADDNNDA